MSVVPVITIDGASGTGKGVVTQRIAQALKWNLLDSGALYRVLAFGALKHQVNLNNEKALSELATSLDVKFVTTEAYAFPHIYYENQDVTHLIRNETVGGVASKIAAFSMVRLSLLDRQRAFQAPPGLVTDGRDMGTVVFPQANLKIFLTATAEERARRRYNQLKENGINVNLSDLIEALRERDQRDSERVVAPLKPAADALVIATDNLTIDQVVEQILQAVGKILPHHG